MPVIKFLQPATLPATMLMIHSIFITLMAIAEKPTREYFAKGFATYRHMLKHPYGV